MERARRAPFMTLDPLSLDRLSEHRSWAYRVARRLVRHEEEADEIVQRAWITAWQRPPGRARGWRPWMRTVILNLVRERSRRDEVRRRHERAATRAEPTRADDACESAEQHELRERLSAHVARLPEPYRTTLRLRYYEALSSPEIGARMGVPPGTVRWRLKVAVDLLREDLDRESDGDRSRWLPALIAAWPEITADAVARPRARPASATGVSLLSVAVAASLLLVLGLGVSAAALRGARPARPPLDARPTTTARITAPTLPVPERVAAGISLPARPPRPAGRELLVEVLDPTGRPLEDALVEVFDGKTFVPRARTGADGRTRIALADGDVGAAHTGARVAIRALAPDQAVSEVEHVSGPFAGGGAPVRLVTAGPARTLTGIVLAPDGRPVAGATVAWVERRQRMRAGPTSLRGPGALVTRSGPDGTFTLEHLPADANGLFCFATDWMVGRANVRGLDHVEMHLLPGARVSGHVRHADGRPAAGVEVAFDPLFPAPLGCLGLAAHDAFREGLGEHTTTGADGAFELRGVHPGKRRLWARDPATGATASVFHEVASDPLVWDARLELHAPVRVRVVDAAGTPLVDHHVQFRAPSGTGTPWTRRLVTDVEGRVTLRETLGPAMVASVFPADGSGSALAIRRGLVPDEVERTIVVSATSSGTITGQLVDGTGRPQREGQLLLYAHRTLTNVGLARDAEGRFQGEVVPGRHSLLLMDDGGLWRVATCSPAPDRPLDLGTVVVPPRAHLRLRSARTDGAPQGYRVDLRELAGRGPYLEVTGGRFEDVVELELYPGTYRVLGDEGGAIELTLAARETLEVVLGH